MTLQEVRELLDELLSKVCVDQIKIESRDAAGGEIVGTTTYPSTDVEVNVKKETVDDYRKADSTDSDYDSDEDLFHAAINAANSDEEFEKITAIPLQRLQKLHMHEYGEEKKRKKKKSQKEVVKNEHEYDKMDPINVPRISLDPSTQLKVLGRVVQNVDCLVKIQCASCIILDFDTILFDEEKRVFGQIYDILGGVREPIYLVRFNSEKEAAAVEKGKTIYYAPDNEGVTKVLLLDDLQAMRIADNNADPSEEACPDFSDDEKEREYHRQKQTRKRQRKPNQTVGPQSYYQQNNGPQQGNWHNQNRPQQHFRQTDWHRNPQFCYSEDGYFYQEE